MEHDSGESGVMIGSRAVAPCPRRAMVAMNFGRSEMFDAVHREDDVPLPVLILLDDARLPERGKERGKERTQGRRRHRVERRTHLGVAGDVLEMIDRAQVAAFLPRLLAEREERRRLEREHGKSAPQDIGQGIAGVASAVIWEARKGFTQSLH